MNKTRTNLLLSLIFVCISFVLISCFSPKGDSSSNVPNTLSTKEIEEGWTLLWDGKSFNGWRGIYKNDFPVHGWIIENGELICLGNEMPDSLKGGDIITDKKYGSFELTCEFKITDKGNSGIKYFVNESLKSSPGHGLGLEFAILDNENWPYDKPDYNRTCGSLYDLIRAPKNVKVQSKGEWNVALIIVDGNHIEHWLNGTKTVEIEKGNEKYNQLLAKSKYANIKGWGDFHDGHILLQDEGPRSSFRNIKIREIKI
ncbi:secreted glycosyl hydrolase [Aquipluma nitroreducens]|uniref:Secreted glycosyl hydrolase n=1 Tax=Aquipluma nitroreducens TaxID=2010828 RepID=A0A5K7S753_9BACT|nr:DUF1080 domain-containing protein [Aquipluma nitroreducens]BBE17154.1 secreted glycosyl hydrolase [Aquipluma nitroreducens]